jgi:hypothetical protein
MIPLGHGEGGYPQCQKVNNENQACAPTLLASLTIDNSPTRIAES